MGLRENDADVASSRSSIFVQDSVPCGGDVQCRDESHAADLAEIYGGSIVVEMRPVAVCARG